MNTFFRAVLVIVFLGNSIAGYSDDFPQKPNPPRLVNDFENIFNENDKAALEQKLVNFNNQTSTQIAVVVLNDIQGNNINEYATNLAHEWGIGQAEKDNGIIILLSPELRQVTIQVGYGLEGVVPDAIAKRIIENEMKPEFRGGNYYAGIDKAVNTIISLTKGEFTADEYEKKSGSDPIAGIIIAFVIIVIISSIFGKARRARHYSVGHDIPFWLALMMMNNSNRGSGKFGNFSSGRGSFGGFGGSGGGGFSGFGGGGFGGGGASGSW